MTKWLARVIQLVVTLGLIAFLVRLVDLEAVTLLLSRADPVFILLALLVSVADRFVMAAKWYPLLRIQLPNVSLPRATRAFLASGVAHYLLPASAGADLLRALSLGRGQRAVIEVGASIVAERVLGIAASAVMAVLAVALASGHGIDIAIIVPWAFVAIALALVALVAPVSGTANRAMNKLTAAMPSARWSGYLTRLRSAYTTLLRRPRLLFGVAVLSLVEQLFPVACLWLTARALDVSIGVGPMLVVTILTLFAVRLPISLGGLGVGEGAIVYLLGLYGVSVSTGLAIALLSRLIDILVNAGPAIFLWRDLVQVQGDVRLATMKPVVATPPSH